MNKLLAVLAVLTLAGSAWAQGNVPGGAVGLWRFTTKDDLLKATFGADLVSNVPENPNWMLGPWTVISVPGDILRYSDGGIAQDRSWDYLTCFHGMSANGGGEYVNEYTIAMDVKPDPGWNSLYQTAWDAHSNDGDLWIDATTQNAATIGVGAVGYSTMTFDATKWHRIVLSVDNGNFFRAYVDGELFLDGPGQPIDGRFSLEVDWEGEPGRFHLFADNNWEDAWILCGTVALWNRALTTDEIAGMGGWIGGSDVPTDLLIVTPGDANMDGVVNALDARNLADNWLATEFNVLNYESWWQMGDFNGDQVVDDLDASILAANWVYTGGGSTAVPEPSASVLLVLGALVLLSRLRRRTT